MRSRLAISSAAALVCAVALAASAQPAVNKPAAPAATHAANANAQTGDVFYFYCAGLHELLATPEDQGLRGLLDALPARLVELAEMDGNMPNPDRTIDTLWTLAQNPLTLRVASVDPADDAAPPLALELRSHAPDPRSLTRQINALMRDAGPTTRTRDAGREFDTPLGPAWFGPDGEALRFSVGGDIPAFSPDWDLPDGYTPVFGFHANFRNAQPLIDMALANTPDQELDQARDMLDRSGLLGEDALIVTVAVGHNADTSVVRGLIQDVRPIAANLGLPEDTSLDREFLSLIPADATLVQAGVMSLQSLQQLADVPEIADALEQVNQELGVDLLHDLLLQVGGRFAMYQSNTTGGGGILSSVGVLELKDPARFSHALDRLAGAFNDAIAQQAGDAPAPMTIQIAPRTAEGLNFSTLAIGGLPIPMEISWTIHDNHLIIALSPRALIEATKQARGAATSFAQSRVLADMTEGIGPGDLLFVSYTDVPRFAVQGYSIVSLLCSALSNAVQTRDGPVPPVALPAFNDFIAGVQPNTATTYWDHDDIRIRGSGNASALVNIAGSGTAILAPAAIGAGTAAFVPAFERARQSAREVKAMANLRQIGMAFHMYAADNNDRCPTSLEDLADYLEGLELTSPLGPCYDGTPDYAVRSDLPRSIARIQDPSGTLIAIDRASIINGNEHVLACFADGHVQSLFSWEFSDLLAQEQNRGAFESFALPDWMNPGF